MKIMSKAILILFLSIGLVNCQLNQDIFLLDSSSENSGSVNYKTLSFSNNSESTSSILSATMANRRICFIPYISRRKLKV